MVNESVRQHLLRAQQRMKHQADKKRTERQFQPGEMVFLKLQPYVQASVVHRACHKLAFRYYRPYKIVERIGSVAYKLHLPGTSRIHPVFHVSQLRQCLKPTYQVSQTLPSDVVELQYPVRVLQRRVKQVGHRAMVQVLVRWSDGDDQAATWED